MEAILGLVMGIPSMILGFVAIAGACNLLFHASPNSPGCIEGGTSNVYGLVGLFLAPLGVIATVASIAVLVGRKRRVEKA